MKLTKGLLIGGRYELSAILGAGGASVVWRTKDQTTGKMHAIKFINSEYSKNPDNLTRFKRESQIMLELNHHGLVKINGYGRYNGSEYIVLEYIDGQSLENLLKNKMPIDVKQTLSFIEQAARALAFAHSKDLVHRDLKPGNILISSHGKVKISDFGIALSPENSPLTSTGIVLGTAQYISPEQAEGKTATFLSDIYSLGIVAYQCLKGSAPFTEGNTLAIALAHLNQQPAALPDSVPEEVRQIIMSMMSKDPAERPQSASQVATAIHEIHNKIMLTKIQHIPKNTVSPAEKVASEPKYIPPASSNIIFDSEAVTVALDNTHGEIVHSDKVTPLTRRFVGIAQAKPEAKNAKPWTTLTKKTIWTKPKLLNLTFIAALIGLTILAFIIF